MSEHCVLVAELARARVFTLEPADVPEVEASPRLVERETLANPQRKAADADLWTDTRRGAHREHQAAQVAGRTTGLPHQNFDEYREDNQREHNRKFAQDVVAGLERVLAQHNPRHLVVCAEKQVLGLLRPEIDSRVSGDVKLGMLAKDLTNLSSHALHQKLAKDGLLPEQRRPPVFNQR